MNKKYSQNLEKLHNSFKLTVLAHERAKQIVRNEIFPLSHSPSSVSQAVYSEVLEGNFNLLEVEQSLIDSLKAKYSLSFEYFQDDLLFDDSDTLLPDDDTVLDDENDVSDGDVSGLDDENDAPDGDVLGLDDDNDASDGDIE